MDISEFLTKYFPIILSVVSLGISFFTLYINRKKVDVLFDDRYELLGDHSVYCNDENNQYLRGSGFGPGLNLPLEIINTSPCEVAYFDLRAFNPDTDENYFLITRDSIPADLKKFSFCRENLKDPLSPYRHLMPERYFGILGANSFERWDLFIIPKDDSTKLRVSFRVAVRRNPLSEADKYVTPNQEKYRYFAKNFGIKGWREKAISLRAQMPADMSLEALTWLSKLQINDDSK